MFPSSSESPVSSDSGSEHLSSSTKPKKKSDPTVPSKSPPRDDSSSRSGHTSAKRTIVLGNSNEKRKDEIRSFQPKPKPKSEPEIEFLLATKVSREKKAVETIHQQAEFNKKPPEVKRETRSPMKIVGEPQRHHSSSSSSTISYEKHSSSKTNENKSTSRKSS